MSEQGDHLESVGVVAIGRNEGDRLRRCLGSLSGTAKRIVYVDSKSTDGSVEMARGMYVDVIELDMRLPFTAARARNEGFRRLRELAPHLTYVQFVDGDCEMAGGWLDAAVEFLNSHPDVAAVCGRRREKHPEHSVYNLVCNIEWDTPIGESRACGGDAMIRVAAFESIKGYRADLIAGEDPEICVRLRGAGWRIWRLQREMTIHDAALSHFGQWWKRSLRAGYAFAQGADLHGAPPELHFVRESHGIWLWGMGIPVGVVSLSIWWGGWALLIAAIYPLQVVRLALRGKHSARENWWHALFLVVGKFPEMLGQVKFMVHRHLGGHAALIEYK
jgi:GT2 family glycosyltransferase